MPPKKHHRNHLAKVSLAVILLAGFSAGFTRADEGDPVAVRLWPDGACSVENMWGLSVVVQPQGIDRELANETNARVFVSFAEAIDHRLSRKVNQAEAQWKKRVGTENETSATNNDLLVRRWGTTNDKAVPMLIRTDGVTICVLPGRVSPSQLPAASELADDIDVLIWAGKTDGTSAQAVADWGKTIAPRQVMVPDTLPERSSQTLLKGMGVETATIVGHNTLAVSHSSDKGDAPRLIRISTTEWQMPDRLTGLFESMEASCKRSQEVFAKLSAAQMSFQPANGTHTPRWNAEHMMGRQLVFFSQIYHAVDPTIPVMDLNPKQMPPDYSPAHPDWDGAEEARQMQRVSEFTRRFAFLLDEVPLQGKAPGSRWTLEGLLKQMSRHYDEHTANTVKKFELADWPKQ